MNDMAEETGLPENVKRATLLKNVPEDVKGLAYFYPNVADSREATKFVGDNADGAGYFLLRLSSKGDDYLAITISIENRSVRHVNVKIARLPSLQYYILEPFKFDSFQELHEYYRDNCITNAEKVKNVKLLHPINRSYDDRETYARFHPPGSRSSSMRIPNRRISAHGIPITPRSHQLTVQAPDAADGDDDDDYVPGLRRRSVTRRKNSASRALPPTPPAPVNRPPCPTPQRANELNLYYSYPTDESRDRIEELRDILKQVELCECGIPLADSDLPHGWTVHMSHDANTNGCLFFQNPAGDTTWILPRPIQAALNEHQYSVIMKLTQGSGLPSLRNLTLRNQEMRLRNSCWSLRGRNGNNETRKLRKSVSLNKGKRTSAEVKV